MRYKINFDKTVNQLIPHFLGGRKLILLLQSILKPLQALNDLFVTYAKETRIEAAMTSQIIKFEWHLNRQLSRYFKEGGFITITNGEQIGVPIFLESANIHQDTNMLLHTEKEGVDSTALYYKNEKTTGNSYSFIVSSPEINTDLINKTEYIALLENYINKYKLAGKTYLIKFNTNNERI